MTEKGNEDQQRKHRSALRALKNDLKATTYAPENSSMKEILVNFKIQTNGAEYTLVSFSNRWFKP